MSLWGEKAVGFGERYVANTRIPELVGSRLVVKGIFAIVEESSTVPGKILVNVCVVNIDLVTEVIDDDGVSQILYSQYNLYEPILIINICKNY